MKKAFNVITKFINLIYEVLVMFCIVEIAVSVVIVFANVVANDIFRSAIRWSQEVVLFFMVWVAFISMAVGVERNLHIKITVFFKFFPKKIQIALGYFHNILTAALGVWMVIYGSKLVKATMAAILPLTQWHKGSMYLMIPVSGVFITYFCILNLFNLKETYGPKVLKEAGEENV